MPSTLPAQTNPQIPRVARDDTEANRRGCESAPRRGLLLLGYNEKSAMTSSGTPIPKPATIQNAASSAMSRPHPLLSDWRISVLVLVGLWAVIYMVGIERPPLLDDVDTGKYHEYK